MNMGVKNCLIFSAAVIACSVGGYFSGYKYFGSRAVPARVPGVYQVSPIENADARKKGSELEGKLGIQFISAKPRVDEKNEESENGQSYSMGEGDVQDNASTQAAENLGQRNQEPLENALSESSSDTDVLSAP